MQKISSKKNLIIAIAVIIVLLIVAYYYFGSGPSSPAPILSDSTTPSSDTLLSTLDELQSISLNSAVFSNPSFQSLKDDTVTLPSVPSGRQNPFAPVAGIVAPSSLAQTSVPVPAH